MKPKLVYEFASMEELQEHVTRGYSVSAAPKAAAAKKKDSTTAPPASQHTGASAADLFAQTPAPVPQAPIPQAPPQQQSPAPVQAPSFDRNAVIANISNIANDIGTKGVSKSEIQALFVEVYRQIGKPFIRLTEADDATLQAFDHAFLPNVNALMNSKTGNPVGLI